jgi:hypothetical protein
MTDTTTVTRYEVRASIWPEHTEPTDSGSHLKAGKVEVAGAYETAGAAAALAAFNAEHPEIFQMPRGGKWHVKCVIPATTPRPDRRYQMNWEKDPDAEVSDGWLSNIAAAGNNLKDELEWEPEFCHRPHRRFPCPGCGDKLAELWSKYGGFYSCPRCGFKTSFGTKKAKAIEAAATIAGFCGTKLEVRYNNNGVPYPGCKTCDPKYKSPTVNDVYYGRAILGS